MALVKPVIGLTETGREGRLHIFSIKMGGITKSGHAEMGNSFAPFLCNQCGDGGWCRAYAMPQQHGRNMQQVAQQDTFQAKMAEESDGIFICRFDPVAVTVSHITVTGEDPIKTGRNPGILLRKLCLME